MESIIKVKSSNSSDTYDVSLKNYNGVISLNCTCKAGIHKLWCKHRIELLNGDVSRLVDKEDIQIVEKFLNSIEGNKIDELFSDLYTIEAEIKKLNEAKKKIRKEVSFKLSNGF